MDDLRKWLRTFLWKPHIYIYICNTNTHRYIYIYTYLCVYIYIHTYIWHKQRIRGSGLERHTSFLCGMILRIGLRHHRHVWSRRILCVSFFPTVPVNSWFIKVGLSSFQNDSGVYMGLWHIELLYFIGGFLGFVSKKHLNGAQMFWSDWWWWCYDHPLGSAVMFTESSCWPRGRCVRFLHDVWYDLFPTAWQQETPNEYEHV